MPQIKVVMASGDEDTWEGCEAEPQMGGALIVAEDGQLVACYAQGMWIKYEVEVLELADPPICGRVHGANEHFFCTLPYDHEGEHNA